MYMVSLTGVWLACIVFLLSFFSMFFVFEERFRCSVFCMISGGLSRPLFPALSPVMALLTYRVEFNHKLPEVSYSLLSSLWRNVVPSCV